MIRFVKEGASFGTITLMHHRTVKQLAFGSIVFITTGIIATGVYYFYLKPAPICFDNKQNQKETGIDCGGSCIPCEVKGLDLVTEEVKTFPAGENKTTLLAKVKNPSQSFPASFSYKFSLGGAFLDDTLRGNAVIAPGASKYLVIPGVAVPTKDIKSIKLEISELNWQGENKTKVRNIGITIETNVKENRITVTGTLANSSATSFPRVDLTALLFGKEGEILNASVTRLEKVEAFSQKQFIVFFPEVGGLIQNLDPQKTEVYWEVDE